MRVSFHSRRSSRTAGMTHQQLSNFIDTLTLPHWSFNASTCLARAVVTNAW
jgi:hypothetical protein